MNPSQEELARLEDRLDRSRIDASCRVPVLMFFGSAIFWLMAGSLLALIASFKMHSPEFLTWDLSFLTFGRVRPAHVNAVTYGWALEAGMGVSIWLMARLSRAPLRNRFLVMGSCVLWNFGVALGELGILSGQGTSIEWLEFPKYAMSILFIAYAGIGVWSIDLFIRRQPGQVYVSQWYLFAALFWFPWLYATANIMLLLLPIPGSIQTVINGWYTSNLLGLSFTPIGLATIYYLIPKVTGQPIRCYFLAVLGFWTFALFYPWTGGSHLIGGPVPLWIVSLGVASSMMLVIPIIVTAINHHATMYGHFHLLKVSPVLRFIYFAAVAFPLAGLVGILMSFPWWSNYFHFTHFTVGHAHLFLYAFFSMSMFGAIYFIVPRLTHWEWPSSGLIKIHFWCAALGIILMVADLFLVGFVQGLGLADKTVRFISIVNMTLPALWVRSVAGILLTIGHLVFAFSFTQMILHSGKRKSEATLLNNSSSNRAEGNLS